MGNFPKRVRLREVGPREGFQTLASIVETSKKLQLIDALNNTGVKEIEIASFVRPDRVPQMADAEEIIKLFRREAGIKYYGLYLNRTGFERGEACGRLDNQGWLNAAASETFLEKNSNTSLKQILTEIPLWLELFAKHGKSLHGVMLSCALGCNYEGDIATSKVLQVVQQLIQTFGEQGVALVELCLADTVGRGNPRSLQRLIVSIQETYPQIFLSLHLHDTRGTGMANVLAGLQEGIELFDTSVGGLGGCPFAKGAAGNVPSEDVAHLCESMGISTGLDLEAYVKAAVLAEQIVGFPLPGKYYKAARKS